MVIRTMFIKVSSHSHLIRRHAFPYFPITDFKQQHTITILLHKHTKLRILLFQTTVFIVEYRLHDKPFQLTLYPLRMGNSKICKHLPRIFSATKSKKFLFSLPFCQQFIHSHFIRCVLILFFQLLHQRFCSLIHSMTTGLATDNFIFHILERQNIFPFKHLDNMNTLRSEERTGYFTRFHFKDRIFKFSRHL